MGGATNPVLVPPGNSSQAGVEQEVLSGRQVIKQSIKLRTVADALLDTQQVLQDAADTHTHTHINVLRVLSETS